MTQFCARWCRDHHHDSACRMAHAGAWWLGMLGFALAAPAATERASRELDLLYGDRDVNPEAADVIRYVQEQIEQSRWTWTTYADGSENWEFDP